MPARITALMASLILLCPRGSDAQPVAVRYAEGLVHGFLALRTLDGTHLADGDLFQLARGTRVTSHLVFRFRDGSLHDETAVFTQRGQFRLISTRLVQKGPSFPTPVDMTVDAVHRTATVRYVDDGESKVETEELKSTDALANGIILTLLKNVRAGDALPTFSMVAATPKPRVVKLEIRDAGPESFSTGRTARKARHYVVKVDIGGIAGVVAPLVGKQPPDSHVWILGGEAPAFIKSEGPMYAGGPSWRIELVSPVWRQPRPSASQR